MTNDAVFGPNDIVRRGAAQERELFEKLLGILLRVINEVPISSEKQASEALLRARELVADASLKAAAIAGTLALPAGPLAWVTIIPELAVIWRLQAQMVADIGNVFGKSAKLTEESLIYCLFRHAAAQVLRTVVTRMGERVIVQRLSLRATGGILENIGRRIVQRVARRGLWRLIPIIGAIGVAGYAYYDTEQVGKTAIELFARDIDLK